MKPFTLPTFEPFCIEVEKAKALKAEIDKINQAPCALSKRLELNISLKTMPVISEKTISEIKSIRNINDNQLLRIYKFLNQNKVSIPNPIGSL